MKSMSRILEGLALLRGLLPQLLANWEIFGFTPDLYPPRRAPASLCRKLMHSLNFTRPL